MTSPETRRADLLLAHDEDLRTEAEFGTATHRAVIGPLLLGRFGEHGFVSYQDLAGAEGAELDALIAAAVDHFAADPEVVDFEWKTRGHDAPADLAGRLRQAGLEPEDAETVMIGEAERLATVPVAALPPGVALRRAGVGGDLAADVRSVGRLHRAVFAGSTHSDERLLESLVRAPSINEVWLAEAGGRAVSAGRLVRVPGTRFAGLFGGATDPAWRHAGIYRALTAARARSALASGVSLLYAECTPFSRPILERAGMLAVTTTTPYRWRARRPPGS